MAPDAKRRWPLTPTSPWHCQGSSGFSSRVRGRGFGGGAVAQPGSRSVSLRSLMYRRRPSGRSLGFMRCFSGSGLRRFLVVEATEGGLAETTEGGGSLM